MFYVCCKDGSNYGVLDTNDGVCEYYTKDDLINISKSVRIVGVSGNKVKVVSEDFIRAKMKLLIDNETKCFSFFKKGNDYIISQIDNRNNLITLVDCNDGSECRVKIDSSTNNLFKKCKILNLFNNKHCRLDFVNRFIFFNYQVEPYVCVDNYYMKIRDLLPLIHERLEDLLDYTIRTVYRINENSLVLKLELNNNYLSPKYIRFNLDTGNYRKVRVDSCYDYSMEYIRYYYFDCGYDFNLFRSKV